MHMEKKRIREIWLYLANGIYPKYATIIKTSTCPRDEKKRFILRNVKINKKNIKHAHEVINICWTTISNLSIM